MTLQRPLMWIRLLSVLVLCFSLRLGVGAVIDATVPVIKRADVYSDVAVNLMQGQGFVAEPGGKPILWRAPLYPAFLAVVYSVFGEHHETAVFVAQTALDSITAILIYWMGRRLFSESVGIFAAAIFALHPLSAYYSLRFMPEPLFTMTFTAVIAAWSVAWQHRRPSAFMAVGALIAVAALVKPVALGLWPFLAVCAGYRLRNQPGRAMTTALVLTIACLMVLTPWMLRNYHVTGRMVLSATGGGYAFWLGNQMSSDGREDWEVEGATLEHLFERRDAILAAVSGGHIVPVPLSMRNRSFTEPVSVTVEDDHEFFLAAWREIASHPFDSVMLTARKFFRFWFSIFLPDNRWAQPYIVVFQSVFLSLAILGMIKANRRAADLFLLLPPAVFLTIATVLTFATIRYSIPIIPVMTILMTAGLLEAVRVLTEKLRGSVKVSQTTVTHGILLNKIISVGWRRRP
jgi:4-amino-4-deoxy-L-arabinose transferase-like glycosyltransferase